MDRLTVTFLPYPHVLDGDRRDGLSNPWPEKCVRCRDRQCERADSQSLATCSYGYQYQRVDESLLIAGIVVRDMPSPTKAYKKALRAAGTSVVRRPELEAVLARAAEAKGAVSTAISDAKKRVQDEYRSSTGFKEDIIELLKPSMEQTFAQVHDYRQLVSQIIQNVNVQLETENPGVSLDRQLDLTSQSVRSVYWAARLMEFKLQSALFVVDPDRISDARHKRVFRFHGSVHKYIKIYKPLVDEKGLKMRFTGESYGSLTENPDAVGVIPQAYLDNAIKYAQPGTEIRIEFMEDEQSIALSVESCGPQIKKAERSKIFDLFFRGEGALQSGEDGTGFGLGLAQLVAGRIGADLSVHQEPMPLKEGAYRTKFSARFQKALASEKAPGIVNARARQRGGPSTDL